jgi:hypothetical protein
MPGTRRVRVVAECKGCNIAMELSPDGDPLQAHLRPWTDEERGKLLAPTSTMTFRHCPVDNSTLDVEAGKGRVTFHCGRCGQECSKTV